MHCSQHSACTVEQNQQSCQPSRCSYPLPGAFICLSSRWSTARRHHRLRRWTKFSRLYSCVWGPWLHRLDFQSWIKCQALQSASPVKSPLTGPWLELRLKLSRPPLPHLWNGENKTTKSAELDDVRYSCKILSPVCDTLRHTLRAGSYLVLRMKHSTNPSSSEIFLKLLPSALISIPLGRLQVIFGSYCDFSL